VSKPKNTAGWVALIVAAVSIIGLSSMSPAHATGLGSTEVARVVAPLGTLSVNPTSGTVTQNPMFASAKTSAACPAGYGTNATLGVRTAGGAAPSPLRPIGSDANYDQAAFSLVPTRSMTVALFGPAGGAVAPGNYELAVLCTGELLGDNPNLFIASITVTGDGWAVSNAPPATTNPPGLGGTVRIETTVAAGPATFTSTITAPVSGGGGSLPITGTAVAMVVMTGLVLFAGGTGLVVAARRRRGARP
jgi:hypothetical protein